MRFSHLVSGLVKEQIEDVARDLRSWEDDPRISDDEVERIRESIQPFQHTTSRDGLLIAGIDGSGDFPSVSYNDSFVYFTTAQGTVYVSDDLCGLKELGSASEPVVKVTVLHEAEEARNAAYEETFAYLADRPVLEVAQRSDYRELKFRETGRTVSSVELIANLLCPHAADASNVGIQFRSCGELGAALRTIRNAHKVAYVLVDGTLSLPLVSSRGGDCLFHELVKRLCCVEARERGIAFLALSKSHGLPSVEAIKDLAREKLGLNGTTLADHWYMRLPVRGIDNWGLSIANGRRLPPPGAVTYLVRFFRSTPVMRLDVDIEYWRQSVQGETDEETRANERRIFEDLDYSCHDQRCYGYPYPIKAGHDRASLTKPERVALRKMIIDAAVRQGVKRSAFRQPSIETGHE